MTTQPTPQPAGDAAIAQAFREETASIDRMVGNAVARRSISHFVSVVSKRAEKIAATHGKSPQNTDEEIRAWVERHDLGSMGLIDARAAIEDAQSIDRAPPAETARAIQAGNPSVDNRLKDLTIEQLRTRLGHCEKALAERDAQLVAIQAGKGDSRLIRVGDLPAPLTHSQAWPQGYVDGWNDYARHVDQTQSAALAGSQADDGPLIEDPHFSDVDAVIRYMDELAAVTHALTGDEGEDDPVTVLKRYADAGCQLTYPDEALAGSQGADAVIGRAFKSALADPKRQWRDTGAQPLIDAVAAEVALAGSQGGVVGSITSEELQRRIASGEKYTTRDYIVNPDPAAPDGDATFQRWSMKRSSDSARHFAYMDHDERGEWVKWTHVQQAILGAGLAALSDQRVGEADDKILWGVVANAGRLSSDRKPRWSHVVDATGKGSTSAAELCRRFGFDPDEQRGGTDLSPPTAIPDGMVVDYKAKYEDLIYQVGRKYEGETRHETAKRYLRQAEQQDNNQAAAAPGSAEGGNGR